MKKGVKLRFVFEPEQAGSGLKDGSAKTVGLKQGIQLEP